MMITHDYFLCPPIIFSPECPRHMDLIFVIICLVYFNYQTISYQISKEG